MMRRGVALFIAALLLLPVPAARTTPLGKDDCAKLKTELGELEHGGVRGNMAKGPQWAKTNLEPEKLEQVRRLLEVDEQLQFRCNGKPLVSLPKDLMDADPAARAPVAKAAKVPKNRKKEGVKKAVLPAADQAAKGATKEEPAAKKAAPVAKAAADKAASAPADTQTAPAAKKTKAKAKSDDAYRAPTPEPGANPFAGQAK